MARPEEPSFLEFLDTYTWLLYNHVKKKNLKVVYEYRDECFFLFLNKFLHKVAKIGMWKHDFSDAVTGSKYY